MNEKYKELLTRALDLLAVATDGFPSDDEVAIEADNLMQEIREVTEGEDKMPEDEMTSNENKAYKYKDLIMHSVKRIDNKKGNYSISLSELFLSMSTLMVYQVVGAEKGQSKKEPTLTEVLDILSGRNFVKGSILSFQIYRFVSWLLEETVEEANDEGEIDWYGFSKIGVKWNEFAKNEMEGESE